MPGQSADQKQSEKCAPRNSVPPECDEELGQKSTAVGLNNAGVLKMSAQFILLLCALFLLFIVQRTQQASVMEQIHNLESKIALYKNAVEETRKVGKQLQDQKAETAELWKSLGVQTTSVEMLKKDTTELQKKAQSLGGDIKTHFSELRRGIMDLKNETMRGDSESETHFEKARFPALWKEVEDLQDRIDAARPEEVDRLSTDVNVLQRKLLEAKQEIDIFEKQHMQERNRRKMALQTELSAIKGDAVPVLHQPDLAPEQNPIQNKQEKVKQESVALNPDKAVETKVHPVVSQKQLVAHKPQQVVSSENQDSANDTQSADDGTQAADKDTEAAVGGTLTVSCPNNCATVEHSCWLPDGGSGRCYTDQGKQTGQKRPLEKNVCEAHGGIWCPDA